MNLHPEKPKTSEQIEKAMMGTHGICFDDYVSKVENLVNVEKARDKEYKKSSDSVADIYVNHNL